MVAVAAGALPQQRDNVNPVELMLLTNCISEF